MTKPTMRKGRRAFTQREILEACIDGGWYCATTGLPLVFPPTLCLLERLVSCAGGAPSTSASGYYDLRQTMWNAPLLTLASPAADHRVPHAKGGETATGNLQLLAGLVNAAKSDGDLLLISPLDRKARDAAEADAEKAGLTPFYWPPARHFWSAPSQRAGKKKTKGPSSDWDGLLGVFLRLYHPKLPEVAADWNLREHAKDASFLSQWYRTVFAALAERPSLRSRYERIRGGLWPSALA